VKAISKDREKNMNKYIICPTCHGFGSVICRECWCPDCNGKGKIVCDYCAGTGKIQKKFLFLYKEVSCHICNGSGSIKCPKCEGIGHLPHCSKCHGKGEIKCPKCGGTRKLETTEYKSWVKSLESLPVDRLRFEYEKRQREIESLQTKTYSLARERDNMEEELKEWEEEHKFNDYSADEMPCLGGINRAYSEISESEDRIRQIQEEMKEIEKVINKKWR
jgi:hypothetical protein